MCALLRVSVVGEQLPYICGECHVVRAVAAELCSTPHAVLYLTSFDLCTRGYLDLDKGKRLVGLGEQPLGVDDAVQGIRSKIPKLAL